MLVSISGDANAFLGDLAAARTWALDLSEDGQYLAGVNSEGRIQVWDLANNAAQIRDQETKGVWGTCIDLVRV